MFCEVKDVPIKTEYLDKLKEKIKNNPEFKNFNEMEIVNFFLHIGIQLMDKTSLKDVIN